MMPPQIKYRDGYKYQLHEPYVVQTAFRPKEHIGHDFIVLSTDGTMIINKGYAWDGPSGVTFDSKNFMRGSLCHDAAYQIMRAKLLDCGWRETADQELRRMCREDGMSWIRAWWVYKAVRLAGEGSAAWQEEKVFTAP